MTDLAVVFRHLVQPKFAFLVAALVGLGLGLPERWLKPFRSVRFNVWLFTAIALASVGGSLVPVDYSFARAEARFGHALASVLFALGFLDVFHSWWYGGLLALMGFDVVACKLRRWPPRRLWFETTKNAGVDARLRDAQLKAEFSLAVPVERATASLKRWMERRVGAVSERAAPGGAVAFAAARHSAQRWGDFLLHVSLVVLLAGGLMGALFGFSEMLPIVEGRTAWVRHRPYAVTVRHFEIQYYPSTGAPRLYESDIAVNAGDREIAHRRIRVNHPLDIDRVRFYQASWGMASEFRSATVRIGNVPLALPAGETVDVPGTGFALRASRFLPSFALGAGGRPVTTDFQGQNPAVQIDFIESGRVSAQVWLLANRPELAYRMAGERAEPAPAPPLRLIAVDPILFSGIQVVYDPGAPVFWAGAAAFMLGLVIHFYLHRRGLLVVIEPDGPGARVRVGGWTSRPASEFRPQFGDWIEKMKSLVA